jgi:hypothetical protein
MPGLRRNAVRNSTPSRLGGSLRPTRQYSITPESVRDLLGPRVHRHARQAVVDADRATADTLNVSLEQMKVVEEMRRTLREIKGVNKLEPN